jgi:hypothetical protein
MTREVRLCRHACVALLAGAVFAFAGSRAVAAGEPSAPPDLSLVPYDCAGFVSVRVADLLGKLGLNGPTDIPLYREWKKQLKMPLDTLERLTLVAFPEAGNDPAQVCAIIRTTRPCKRDQILKDWIPDARQVAQHDRAFHVSKDNKAACCFVDERLFLMGQSVETLAHCLSWPAPQDASLRQRSFAEALKLAAGKHDFVAWGRASALPQQEAMPFPSGIEAGRVVLDLRDKVTFELRLHCADGAAKKWADKALRTGLNLARIQILMLPTMLDGAELFRSKDQNETTQKEAEILRALPVDLFRLTEKALQRGKVQTESSAVCVQIAIPASARRLRSAMDSYVQLVRSESLGNCELVLPFPLASHERMIEKHHPGPRAADPPGPMESLRSIPDPPLQPARYEQPATTPSTGPGLLPLPGGTPPGAEVKVTVANVRKEPALVFTLMEDGKLSFLQKVGPGEAVDLTTVRSRRLVAVFSDKPAGETFEVKQNEATWLLR